MQMQQTEVTVLHDNKLYNHNIWHIFNIERHILQVLVHVQEQCLSLFLHSTEAQGILQLLPDGLFIHC